MNALINYGIEANLGLLFFAMIYVFVFRSEHTFSVKRLYLLAAINISMIFPLFHFDLRASTEFVPSIGQIVPTYWLPEVVITPNGTSSPWAASIPAWSIFEWVYGGVFLVLALVFVFQLSNILQLYFRSKKYLWKQCMVCESSENKPTFSFFRFIFIGQVGKLTPQEKEDVLLHESVHVHQFHSLDILFVTIVGILFWFNPIVRFYKSALFQLHEFEADAVAIENKDVDAYCSLLSKLTLDAIGYPLAHHFNHSLTIKRINMMKTMKQKIQSWKLVAILATVPVFFFVVACRDQVAQELASSTVTQVAAYPKEVQDKIAQLRAGSPSEKYTYIEGTNEDIAKLTAKTDPAMVRSVWVWKKEGEEGVIGVLLSNVAGHAEDLKMDGEVFTIVEESATPAAGIPAFYEYIAQHLKYPTTARTQGIQGKVFIEFVVNPDSTLSDFKVMRSLSQECDQEAIRVLTGSPAWIPGKQRGIAVKQRYVLPITFSLENGTSTSQIGTLRASNEKMTVSYEKTKLGNKTRWVGTVIAANGKPLPGINIVVKDYTQGTVSDVNGKFQLDADKDGPLVLSFVGFESVEIE